MRLIINFFVVLELREKYVKVQVQKVYRFEGREIFRLTSAISKVIVTNLPVGLVVVGRVVKDGTLAFLQSFLITYGENLK